MTTIVTNKKAIFRLETLAEFAHSSRIILRSIRTIFVFLWKVRIRLLMEIS